MESNSQHGDGSHQVDAAWIVELIMARLRYFAARGLSWMPIGTALKDLEGLLVQVKNSTESGKFRIQNEQTQDLEAKRIMLEAEVRTSERMLDGTLSDARSFVRILLALNGGGAIALMTFLAPVLVKPEFRSLSIAIAATVFLFSLALLFTVLVSAFSYLANLFFYRRQPQTGRRLQWTAYVLAIIALLFFLIGIVVLGCGFGCLLMGTGGHNALG